MKIKTPDANNQSNYEYSSTMEKLFDKYIDLGLENFILKNKDLLNPSKEELIGRIRICQMLNIDIFNNDETLIDFLFQDSFLYDKFTIELITTNDGYKYIDQKYKQALERKEIESDISEIIEKLKPYDHSKYSYKIEELYISKNRLYKNLKKLSPFLEEDSEEKILFLSIIYQGCYTNFQINNLVEMKNQKHLIK